LVAFDNLTTAARDANWHAFGTSPRVEEDLSTPA